MRIFQLANIAMLVLGLVRLAPAADANRLTYLDEFCDPYYVGRDFPKLVTPQWVGEEGVEAVVILAIDDMRETQKYEDYLRPILNRLKEIDGRAPVSIMTNRIDPAHPQLTAWLEEGLSLEVHTYDHPCPCLADRDFAKAKQTYDRSVDLMASIPGSQPVAFRMPCCDSMNSVSPRFFTEVFNKTTAKGNFLSIDSSVFMLFTERDPELPRELVRDEQGRNRFAKYVPFDRGFVNLIEDYPYPYVIGGQVWQLPCIVPSDWEAQHLHRPFNPMTVRDMQAGIDATVAKRGVFTLVFHPHGWISSEQVVQLIDDAVKKHGKRVKFLNFREAQQRLNKNLLAGQSLRTDDGQPAGVRLVDLNNDGYMDVVMGNAERRQTRVWLPDEKKWTTGDFPFRIVHVDADGKPHDAGARFGVFQADGHASVLVRNEHAAGFWHFDGGRWIKQTHGLRGLELDGPIMTAADGKDRGVRLRDLDDDGRCELIVGNVQQNAVFAWNEATHSWRKLPLALPAGTRFVDQLGRDAGLRLVDVDENGHADVVFANEQRYGLHLFTTMDRGWSTQARAGRQGEDGAIPPIVRDGTNNGAWFHGRDLIVQNENTSGLEHHVARLSAKELLGNAPPAPRSPEASLRSIETGPGLAVELVAAEPLVKDPVNIAWGPDGRLWVVEMADYPLGMDGKGKPGGRVRWLADTDGDGRYDLSTLFLDGIPFPTGVMPWRNGVLVTTAPDVFYAEDTDGDGRADRRVTLYSGFGEGNQQHRVNGLRWGLDNWIYLANGDSDGKIKSAKTGEVVDVRGRDLRIRPDQGLLDAQSGRAQYGRNRDDWGNWFGGNNSNPMWHYRLADHYLRRNPHTAPPAVHTPVSVTPGAAPVFPISQALTRFNNPGSVNHFTSACSVMVYRDRLLGPEYVGNAFICEPVHNLVHREVMSASGTTFTSRRADSEREREFLASSDNWFRPTAARTGPDGALWIVDMYRFVIEHPEWIPQDWQARLNLRAGEQMGRIYRVVPAGKPPRTVPRLDRLDTAGLVAALDSPSGWQRDLAQQMLLWRRDKNAVPPLVEMAAGAKRPLARLHALCTLDGLERLDEDIVLRALEDGHPGVRRHAVRLAEVAVNDLPSVRDALLGLLDDEDPQVRLQLAYTLGAWQDPRSGHALARLARGGENDPYLMAAVMSSVTETNLGEMLSSVLGRRRKGQTSAELLDRLLTLSVAVGDQQVVAHAVRTVIRPEQGKYTPGQLAGLVGMLDALERRGLTLASSVTRQDRDRLGNVFARARDWATHNELDESARLIAIRLLGRQTAAEESDQDTLAGILSPQNSPAIQAAAVAQLGRLGDERLPEQLLASWRGHSPALRSRIVDLLLSHDAWRWELLAAIERGDILPGQLDARRRQRLLEHPDKAIRQLASKLFATAVATANRRQVIEQYQDVLQTRGDILRGKEVFRKRCATCHKLEGVGNAIGPDLAALSDKSPASLLTAVLDPNRAVEGKFIDYTAVTDEGRIISGMLTAETGTSITLAGAEGKSHVILRIALEELRSSGKSVMPEGLEKDLSRQDLADVIAYVAAPPPIAAQPSSNVARDGQEPEQPPTASED